MVMSCVLKMVMQMKKVKTVAEYDQNVNDIVKNGDLKIVDDVKIDVDVNLDDVDDGDASVGVIATDSCLCILKYYTHTHCWTLECVHHKLPSSHLPWLQSQLSE